MSGHETLSSDHGPNVFRGLSALHETPHVPRS
jgi:hypothetical protein